MWIDHEYPAALARTISPMTADLVLLEGNVLTMDAAGTSASAVAITDGVISFVGSSDEARDHIGPRTRVESLGGRTVLPGINDSHMHVCAFGRSQLELNCSGDVAPSIAQVVRLVADAVAVTTAC